VYTVDIVYRAEVLDMMEFKEPSDLVVIPADPVPETVELSVACAELVLKP
jgi:hypothetical protein